MVKQMRQTEPITPAPFLTLNGYETVKKGSDLWTVISGSGSAATMWLRFADEPNDDALTELVPELHQLPPGEALEATDIVNSLFPSYDAMRFIHTLLRDPEMGSDHRAIRISQPGVRELHRRLWRGQSMCEHFPFGGWDPFHVIGVGIPAHLVPSLGSHITQPVIGCN